MAKKAKSLIIQLVFFRVFDENVNVQIFPPPPITL